MGVLAKAAGSLWDWIEAGYPEEVAKRIVSGELPMDEASRMARAQEQGYGDVLYRGQPDRPLSSNQDIWASTSPDVAQTYADNFTVSHRDALGEDGIVVPLRTNATNMADVNARGRSWHVVESNNRKIPGIESGVLKGTDRISEAVRDSGKYDGTVFRNIPDDAVRLRGAEQADSYNILGSRPDVNIRHADAAYDPKYTGPNIMGGVLAGGVGLGALGQSEDADAGPVTAALKRAAEQGFTNRQYHASMQDFDTIVPGYSDGLFFTTPDPEFAANWAGKGKKQARDGELDAYDRYKPQQEALYESMGSPEYGTPEYDEFTKLSTEILQQEQNAFKTVYPLLTRTDKTFDPARDFDDLADLYTPEHLASGVSSDYPTFADALKSGNYIFYENPEVVKHLKSKGYDSMLLRESTWDKASRDGPHSTLAHFYPERNVRSQFAEFAEGYSGPNISGNATVPALGVLATGTGAALAAPALKSEGLEKATGFLDETIRSARHAAGPLSFLVPYEGISNFAKKWNADEDLTWQDYLGLLDF